MSAPPHSPHSDLPHSGEGYLLVKSACWVCPSRRAWFLPKSKTIGPLGAAWPSALAAGCRVCGNPTTVVGKGGRHPRVASQRAHALLTTHSDLDEVGVEIRRPLWAWSGASRTSSPVRCLLLRTRAALARHMQRTSRLACSPQSPWCPQRPWPEVMYEQYMEQGAFGAGLSGTGSGIWGAFTACKIHK